MTAKITADATGTKVIIGTAAENALQIDATAKTIKALSPYKLEIPYRSGEVLQIVTHLDAGTNQTVTDWVSLTGVAASITPKSTNSTLIVECCFSGNVSPVSGVNAEALFQINNGSVPSGLGGNYVYLSAYNVSGGIGIKAGVSLMWAFSNTSLAARSFAMTAYPDVGSPNNLGAFQQAWKITEVQN